MDNERIIELKTLIVENAKLAIGKSDQSFEILIDKIDQGYLSELSKCPKFNFLLKGAMISDIKLKYISSYYFKALDNEFFKLLDEAVDKNQQIRIRLPRGFDMYSTFCNTITNIEIFYEISIVIFQTLDKEYHYLTVTPTPKELD